MSDTNDHSLTMKEGTGKLAYFDKYNYYFQD